MAHSLFALLLLPLASFPKLTKHLNFTVLLPPAPTLLFLPCSSSLSLYPPPICSFSLLYIQLLFSRPVDTHSLREGSGAHRTCFCSTPFFRNPCAHVPIGVNPKRSAYASKPRNPHLHIAFSVPGHGVWGRGEMGGGQSLLSPSSEIHP